MKNKIIFFFTIFAMLNCLYSVAASAAVFYDFENGIPQSFQPLYDNANMSINVSGGNHYLRISYNGQAHRDREYYDVKVANVSPTGILQIDCDLMYSEANTEKNGEIQLKNRTGPGSAETQMVAGLGKNNAYFRYHNSNNDLMIVKNLSGQTLNVSVGHWYSVKITVDFNTYKQSIYIFDRDTKELLSYMNPIDTINHNKNINMVTLSSGTDMCIDNLKIYTTTREKGYIYGSPYVASASKTKYYLFGQDSSGNLIAPPAGEITWSLETPRENIRVDEPTGRIITGTWPEPGPVIIKAKDTSSDGVFTGRAVVYVSK